MADPLHKEIMDYVSCWRTNYGLSMPPQELAAYWREFPQAAVGATLALRKACEWLALLVEDREAMKAELHQWQKLP